LPDSEITNEGSVRFERAPGNQGTEVHVELIYQPPAGALGALLAKLFGEEPKQQIKSDLRRLKQVLETGEVTHSDASIHRGTHPAQPSHKSSGVPAQPFLVGGGALGSSHRPLADSAPPKPISQETPNNAQRTASGDAPNDAMPYTHSTEQGSGKTRDDDAS
jgi:hypothetical protein